MRKFIWGLLVVIFVGGMVFLSVNSSKTLATSTAGKITEKDFYNEIKKSSAGKQEFAKMVINKVLEDKYGDNVSKADVDSAFEAQKSQYGSSFKEVLASNNMTEKQLKDSLRNNLLTKAAIKANYNVTEKQIKKAYDDYKPAVTISMLKAKNEENAKNAANDIKDGKSWSEVYKKYSTDSTYKSTTGKISAFDSTSTSIDSSIQNAAFKLNKVGDYAVTSDSSGNYYLLKLEKKTDKPSLNNLRSKLTEQIITEFMNSSDNTSKVQAIIGKILRKADVSVKDSDLKSSLNTYLTAGISSNNK